MKYFLLFLLSLNAWSDSALKESLDIIPASDVIDEGVIAGPYLIYNCKDGHWTCVIEEDFKECEAARVLDQKLGKKRYSCAPIQKLTTKRSCFQRQLYLVGQNHGSRFCISDAWKQRVLR